MRIQYLQHVPFEGPARIAEWAAQAGHSITGTRLDLGQPLPDPREFDMLVVMGGPMSVNDERVHPWLKHEKQLLATIMERETHAVLGVCLGAQLIASALGAAVTPTEKEIGWLRVRRTCPVSDAGVLAVLPDVFVPLHWHGETFELPRGAVHCARSDGCLHQAFIWHNRVVALQCHLEATAESTRNLVEHCRDDISDGPYQQDPEQISNEAATRSAATWPLLVGILDALAAQVVATADKRVLRR